MTRAVQPAILRATCTSSPEERLRILALVCEDAARMLVGREDSRELREHEHRDPLPESSVRALRRLRHAATGQGRGG